MTTSRTPADYSQDPLVSAFGASQAPQPVGDALIDAFTIQPQAVSASKPAPKLTTSQNIIYNALLARQGTQATGMSLADMVASLPKQVASGLTYGVSRVFGTEPARAQQLAEGVATPLSYLEPGKLASAMNPQAGIGQGSKAYESSFVSKIMGFIDQYGAQPTVDFLVKQGMNPNDAQQLVVNAPLLVAGGFKVGKMAGKTLAETPAWAQELKTGKATSPTGMQSAGAAAAVPESVIRGNIDAALANASPELQAHINKQPTAKVNLPALETRALEEKHGVNLSEGQRLGDTSLYSQEWNKRGETPTLSAHFNEQPVQISNAFERAKERHAPDIPAGADASELGQLQINALAAKDRVRLDAINNAYQKLTDAAGGQFPIDIGALNQNIASELSRNLKTNHLPSSIASDLADFTKNPTFEAYEALRTNLANEMRSNANGNARAAAYIVRDQLEKLPIFGENTGTPQALQLKELADNARSLVKERYSVLNSNPAYKAAVNEFSTLKDAASQGESLNAAKFHQKYVSNATPEAIRRLKAELPEGDIAHQAITYGELQRAKNAAVNASERNLTPEQYAKFLRDNASKLRDALPPSAMQDVVELGALTSKIGMPKTGTFNYSNTYSSQLANMAKEGLLTAGEAKLATMTGGASIPATGLTRQFLGKMGKESFAKRATDPFAGLTKE